MRWVTLALVTATGCSKLFGLQEVGVGDGSAAPIDGPPPHLCFAENFDNGIIDTSVLNVASPPQGGSTMPSAQGVQVTWPAGKSGDDYGYVETIGTFDLTGADASIDVDDMVGDMAEATLYVTLDPLHTYVITTNTNTFEFDLYDGSSSSYTVIGEKTTFSTRPLHLRIADDDVANEILFEVTTPSGKVSTPTTLAFTVSAVTVGFAGGSYASATANGQAQFDNFAVTSRTCL